MLLFYSQTYRHIELARYGVGIKMRYCQAVGRGLYFTVWMDKPCVRHINNITNDALIYCTCMNCISMFINLDRGNIRKGC